MPVKSLRSLLVRARDALHGVLHLGRKRRAEARLAAIAPRRVLFICLGNVCRSPYAERILSSRLPDVDTDSAGFIGPDRPPPDTALEVARLRGVDHGDHRSKVLTPELLAANDAVFVFDRFHVTHLKKMGLFSRKVFWLGDFDPAWSGKRAIIDPWGEPADEFDHTFARIERCVDEVVGALARTHDLTAPRSR